jgi:4'-phosphopantetheinyl transferase
VKDWGGRAPGRLAEDDLHVWRGSLADREGESFRRWLSAEERRRADAFRFDRHRRRFLVSHAMLRDVLACYLDAHPAELAFTSEALGKPHLVAGGVEFNLSHAEERALVAVAAATPVGVDLEHLRDVCDADGIARRVFSASERSDLAAVDSESAFLAQWTRKEAYLKGRGVGLASDVDSGFRMPAAGPGLRRVEDPAVVGEAWWIHDLEPGPGYVGAVAVKREACRLRLFDWSRPLRADA